MNATHSGAIFIVNYHNQCRYCHRIVHLKLTQAEHRIATQASIFEVEI
ncbi:MAG: hypothetical protein KME43_15620 [Myxacorys chilensis ATA2-1-KO14]|jgi:hypothetical protein|nr:hypothetical protein [Myxacorys chilensis ATA2-1-KO14]